MVFPPRASPRSELPAETRRCQVEGSQDSVQQTTIGLILWHRVWKIGCHESSASSGLYISYLALVLGRGGGRGAFVWGQRRERFVAQKLRGEQRVVFSFLFLFCSPGPCSCWAPLGSCSADFAGIRRSGSCRPRCAATPGRPSPSTPRWNVWTPGGVSASGSGESAFRRPTACRTAGAAEAGGPGPRRAAAPPRGPSARVSAGPAGGASQCSSGTPRSRPPAPGPSPGSAAGRTGTPLLQEKQEKKGKKKKKKRRRAWWWWWWWALQCPPAPRHTLRVVWKSLKFRSRHHHQAQCPSQRLPQNLHNSPKTCDMGWRVGGATNGWGACGGSDAAP